jgi:arylesterase / paraoxonase
VKKVLLSILMILAACIGYAVVGILIPAGVFKTIEPHYDGTVQKMDLPIAGPEDITIDQATGTAFISVDDRRVNMKQPGSVKGGMLMMNLNDSIRTLRDITPAQLDDFHPHGISLWKSSAGRIYLFVINHRQKNPAHVVERFEWINDTLVHLESIQDETRMTSPNDLVAVGERSFYVTNDHYYARRGLGRTLEDYLQRAIAYVNYFDGTSFTTVAEGIAYPNGIAFLPHQSHIIVAATTGRKVLVYDRDPVSGTLSLKQEIKTDTGVDNIEVDNQGSLWIGCHPQLLKFAGHAADAGKFSPSQVLKLTRNTSGDYTASEIFLNDGTSYSGSSVAAVYNNTLLIGSVFEKSILICSLNVN